jgi:hypothetical protein
VRVVRVPVASWFIEVRVDTRIGRLTEWVLDTIVKVLGKINGPLVQGSMGDPHLQDVVEKDR